ncbi:hypothetical protein BDF14DRAFT_1822214 [Spinellus fusiger]|nr:hypothetical protein BDF14DRAFT_1822214 [Spinellus fusiger]
MDPYPTYTQPTDFQEYENTTTLLQEPSSRPFFDNFQDQTQQLASVVSTTGLDFSQPSANVVPPSSVPLSGVYSSSGFDMIGVLSRLVNRPNPQINLGPIDMSCSFLVTDARQYDHPIVYCSPTFEHLTGYKGSEIVGRNCRFLQAPDGQVTGGSRRQYTDNQAVYHLKAQMLQSNEHQASIINYRKGGQPFVNLITVIPICIDSNETAFFVGLQVDLVEQPNAILEKMKDGTYLVNYQQMNIPPYIPSGNLICEPVDDYFRELPTIEAPSTPSLVGQEILSLVKCSGENENQFQQEWNKLLLEQSEDFIHVLSLKGFFLYCSSSSSNILEHDPEELVGHSLSSICHPSDIVPVMREIKEAASDNERVVNLVYRVRRKYSGYMWMECQGKLHVDQGKGRKCLILSGRERSMYHLSRHHLNLSSTVHAMEPEFWIKASLTGLNLHVTTASTQVVGYTAEFLEGVSIFQYVGDGDIPEVTHAFKLVKAGQVVNIEHTIQNSKGHYIHVLSTLYPGDIAPGSGQPSFALMQIRAKEVAKANQESPLEPMDDTQDTNIFSELETVRGTSWQYELHQLQMANQKLRDQIDKMSSPKRRKVSKEDSLIYIYILCY